MSTVYDFSLKDKKGNEVQLSDYKGQVLLIVNTATQCGFTPQLEELEAIYKRLHNEGLEILSIPSNQFGEQAPGSDEEIAQFCSLSYGTEFPQFKKSDVNGDNQLPLYKWLKEEKGFVDFDMEHKIAPILVDIYDKQDPDWRMKSDIKWSFTKFLVDREGNVVERFEPTKPLEVVEEAIKKLL